ncbi:hypothetical protein, partial [Prevotella pectinovora]|uniref:hypothetical protein n=1 Tax=Prevotella pectinovora TaxID=1602169 RepID=UPI003079165A
QYIIFFITFIFRYMGRWEDGKMGILEKMPSLFLSLAISLRSTFAMPHVIVFAGFTGTEL